MTSSFFGNTPAIEGIDFAALRGWMDAKSIGRGPIRDVEALVGGTQNIMVRFNRGDDRYVLRRPPLHKRANSDKTMLREARVLGALGASQVPRPRLIASCPDRTVLGSTFYLATWIDGFNPTVIQPDLHMDHSEIPRKMGFSHIEAIAHLGNVNWRLQGLDDFGKPEGWLARQVPRWRSHWEGYLDAPQYSADELVGVDVIGAWLERRMPEQGKAGIVHGDCHLANTLFSWERADLVALVDWELATIGDPMLDLGWVLATNFDARDEGTGLNPNPLAELFPTPEELIVHYGEVSGRDVTNAWWYGVLACYKLAIIIEGTYVRFLQGKAHEDVGVNLHTVALSLFRRAERFMLHQA